MGKLLGMKHDSLYLCSLRVVFVPDVCVFVNPVIFKKYIQCIIATQLHSFELLWRPGVHRYRPAVLEGLALLCQQSRLPVMYAIPDKTQMDSQSSMLPTAL